MSAVNPPSDPAAQLRWLVDREAIRDLISSFGVAVDDKQQAAYADTFTDDATLELPFGRFEGKAVIRAMKGPPPNVSTQHLFGNIVITLAGDTATARAYMMATHAFDPADLAAKAHSGGWYDYQLARTPDGWRFTSVRLVPVWADKRPMIPGGPVPAGTPA